MNDHEADTVKPAKSSWVGTGPRLVWDVEIGPLSRKETIQLAECEGIIRAGFNAYIEVGKALRTIRDGKLYRYKFGTFQAYCAEVWGNTARWGRNQIRAAEVAENLLEGGSATDPATESQARPLASLKPAEQRAAWALAQTMPGPTTAAKVERAKELLGLAKEKRKKAEVDLREEFWAAKQISDSAGRVPRAESSAARSTGSLSSPGSQLPEGGKKFGRGCGAGRSSAAGPDMVGTAQPQPPPQEKWPQPNEHGVYDKKGCEPLGYVSGAGSVKFTADVYLLQIGQEEWISTWDHDSKFDRNSSALTKRRVFKTRADALCAACDDGYGILSRMDDVPRSMAAVIERAMRWARLTSGRVEAGAPAKPKSRTEKPAAGWRPQTLPAAGELVDRAEAAMRALRARLSGAGLIQRYNIIMSHLDVIGRKLRK